MSNVVIPNQIANAEEKAKAMIEGIKAQKEANEQVISESFFSPETLNNSDSAEPTNSEPNFEPQTVETPEQTPVEAPAKKEKIDPEDWKSRFTGYKAKTDTTIYELRQNQKQLKEQLEAMQTQNRQLAGKISEQSKTDFSLPDGTLTDELMDELGIDQMNQQLIYKQQEQEIEAQQKSTTDFAKSVLKIVPDLYAIDKDEGFVNFLNGYDEFGQQRRQLCQAAMNNFDVHGFARFYMEYQQKHTATNAKEALVTPKPGGSSDVTANKQKSRKIWRKGEFANMSKLLSIGKISQKEFDAAQADYTQGIQEGRVQLY